MTRPLNHRSTHDNQPGSSTEQAGPAPEKGESLINPRYHFHPPQAVLHSDELDRQEKIEVLKEWAADLREERRNVSRTFQMSQLAGSGELEEVRSVLNRLRNRRQKAA